jgi:hypothetical protein
MFLSRAQYCGDSKTMCSSFFQKMSGTDVMILKNWQRNLRYLLKLQLVYAKNYYNIVFLEKRHFFPKLALITENYDHNIYPRSH